MKRSPAACAAVDDHLPSAKIVGVVNEQNAAGDVRDAHACGVVGIDDQRAEVVLLQGVGRR